MNTKNIRQLAVTFMDGKVRTFDDVRSITLGLITMAVERNEYANEFLDIDKIRYFIVYIKQTDNEPEPPLPMKLDLTFKDRTLSKPETHVISNLKPVAGLLCAIMKNGIDEMFIPLINLDSFTPYFFDHRDIHLPVEQY